ncbi:MAG TPA: leucyl aminopeptidase [Pirellulales bacterium]|jgi:leucyl aminopeptidase|nr:leucyl aminopeptidase [Pirellulales bacterium]
MPSPITTPLATTAADAIVVGIFSDSPLAGPAAEADRAIGGLLSKLIERKEITGKRFELTTLLAPSGIAARQLLVVGTGDRAKFDAGTAHRVAAAAARHLAGKARARVAFFFGDGGADCSQPAAMAITEAAVAGAIVGSQGQDLYKAEKKRTPPGELLWSGGDEEAVRRGQILGESVNLTRRLVNEPPHDMYPESFAAEAEKVAKESGLAIEVWDQPRLERERCGSLLAVARGSYRPPRLVILRYNGAAKDAPLLAWVGKGVTFDSGGLSLKTPDGMLTMKCDMAGAATVLGAMRAVAKLKLPVNIVGLMGLVENMTGSAAYKLGDVLTARNGRTIEVHNTDAEGRLVLADVLCVTVETGAAKIIDLATLTGACVVALGTDVAGLMTNDQPWCDAILAAARTAGEPAWQLPMFPEFDEQIKGEVADIKNVGEGRWGGAITAAKFLEQFVEKKSWTHMDIAGPAYNDKPKPWTDGGGSGAMLRTLVEVARDWTG